MPAVCSISGWLWLKKEMQELQDMADLDSRVRSVAVKRTRQGTVGIGRPRARRRGHQAVPKAL